MPITLFIPDLFRLCSDNALEQRYPAIESLITRAHMQTTADDNAVIARLFGMPAGFGEAPFMRLADNGAPDRGFYFRADPVHLAPDRDRLVMLPLSVMQVQKEETSALVEVFNNLYEREGYTLEALDSTRWYIRVPEPLRCETHPTSEVSGRPVLDYMPRGEEGLHLRRLMNEIQMLFHGQPVNLARESTGQPSINSLWFWGGGCLPEQPIEGPDQVLTDMPLIAGLGQYAGCKCSVWSGTWLTPLSSETQLIAINCSSQRDLAQMERGLAVPMLQALQQGKIAELLICPGNQRCYMVTRNSQRKFWRRPRPLADLLHTV